MQATTPQETIFAHFQASALSRALYAAVRLGLADCLDDRPLDAAQLAKEAGVDAQALSRLMRLLVSHGIFAQNEDKRYAHTSLSKVLSSKAEGSLHDFILKEEHERWQALGHLDDAIRTGEPSFDRLFGCDFYTFLKQHPEAQSRFYRGMTSLTVDEDRALAKAFPFGDARRLIDIGGGQGGLLAALLAVRPQLDVTLFDLPQVVADKQALKIDSASPSVHLLSGDFFAGLPQGYDLYVVKRVLHNWSDDVCVRLLTDIRLAKGPAGRVVVAEMALDDAPRPDIGKEIDVYTLCLSRGKERTQQEFASLFERAGLCLQKVYSTSSRLKLLEAC